MAGPDMTGHAVLSLSRAANVMSDVSCQYHGAGSGDSGRADVFRLGSNTGSVSHQDPGQPPHPALSCLQRRGSPPGFSLPVDFVSIAET